MDSKCRECQEKSEELDLLKKEVRKKDKLLAITASRLLKTADELKEVSTSYKEIITEHKNLTVLYRSEVKRRSAMERLISEISKERPTLNAKKFTNWVLVLLLIANFLFFLLN